MRYRFLQSMYELVQQLRNLTKVTSGTEQFFSIPLKFTQHWNLLAEESNIIIHCIEQYWPVSAWE